MEFAFELGDRVALTYGIDEVGDLVGIAKYTFMHDLYYVRYTAADGRAAESWFDKSQLKFLSRPKKEEKASAESSLKAALSTFSEPKASAAAMGYSAMGSGDTVVAANNTISMNHEAIPALKWPAMTMEFGLADGNVAKGLLPGQAVHFSFEDRGNGEFVIVRLEKMDGKRTTSHQGAH